MFCPKCGDEFRPGFSTCPDCELPLVDRLPPRQEPSHEAEELVTVATFPNVFEAAVAKGALEAEGVTAFVSSEDVRVYGPSGPSPEGIWPEVRVRTSDRDHAIEVLRGAGHE